MLTVFTQRNFAADFLQTKCNFTQKTAVLEVWGQLTMFILGSIESM